MRFGRNALGVGDLVVNDAEYAREEAGGAAIQDTAGCVHVENREWKPFNEMLLDSSNPVRRPRFRISLNPGDGALDLRLKITRQSLCAASRRVHRRPFPP